MSAPLVFTCKGKKARTRTDEVVGGSEAAREVFYLKKVKFNPGEYAPIFTLKETEKRSLLMVCLCARL